MIWEVIKKEIRVNITSPKLMITYVVCFVLIIAALFTGAMNYLSLREEAQVQAAAEKDRLANVFNFQMDLTMQGMNLYREPDKLSVLISGVEGDSARRGNVNSFTGATYDISKFNSSPILAIFGMLDLGFIIKIILSLFAILFTYDAVCGEKELGTLKLNFANEIKRSSFIIGKLIGNFVLLILPFIIPMLLGLLLVSVSTGIEFSPDDWTRIGLIMLAAVLYLLTFYSMGMMVSSIVARPAVSFLILLMLWVLFIGIIPRAAVLTAQTLAPVPPLEEVRMQFFSEFGDAQDGFMQSLRGAIVELFDLVREAQRTQDPTIGARIQAKQQEMQDTILDSYQEFTNKMQTRGEEIARQQGLKQERQNQLAIHISRIASPAAAFTFATDNLARTGVYSSDEEFKDNVKGQLQTFSDYINNYIDEHPQELQGAGIGVAASDHSEAYPDVQSFTKQSIGESVMESLMDFAAMAILSLVLMAVAFMAFLRYDVR